MAGYFKVPLAAARNILELCEGPELLAGYMTLRRHAFGSTRNLTAAGAKAVKVATGCTDWRSKRVMDDLRTLRFGEGEGLGLVESTGRKKANAHLYRLPTWGGVDAYVPALILDRHPEYGSAVLRICQCDSEPSVQRDALYLLLHLYSLTDYAGWMGAPPDVFVHQLWERDGSRCPGNADHELGYYGREGDIDLWLVALPEDHTWTMPHRLCEALFGDATELTRERFWRALWCLLGCGAVCKVAVVSNGRDNYPLWVFSPAYRKSLEELGIKPDLADSIYRLASDAGYDADNYLIIDATSEDREPEGTGLFFCVGKDPKVRTLLIPRLHAPTPVNLDGLREIAAITGALALKVANQRKKARSAA